MDQTEAEAIAALAQAGSKLCVVEDGVPFVIVPQHYKLESLENLLSNPSRIRKSQEFIALESFNRYVNKFKQPDSRVMVSAGGNAVAILDGSSPTEPMWESHSATFRVTHSDRFRTWDGSNKKPFAQRQFAEFVEDNIADFSSPKGAAMLDIAKTLHAEQNSTFKSAVRLENGDVHFEYQKNTTARAGQKDEVDIPSEFTISIPVLEGESTRLIPVRLRYELAEGKLSFHYEILRRSALMEEVRRSIYAEIANETGIEPFLVP